MMNPTHAEQGTDPHGDRIVPVRMPESTWRLVVKALRESPMAGNYLIAASIMGIEDTLGAVKGPDLPPK